MTTFFASRPAYIALRFIMGLLFVYAGILKLSNPAGFALTINIYGIVTWQMSNWLSYLIPIVEILTGLGLILDVKGSLACIVAQLLGFMGVLLYAMYLGLDADCGCFGTPTTTEHDPVGPLEGFIRDGFMLAACIAIYWQRKAGGYTPRALLHPFSKTS